MVQHQDTSSQRVSAPVLRWPREEAVVHGAAVHFVWDPLPEAGASYTLQVAADPDFANLVVEQELGEAREVLVRDAFPTDGRTFYWRVLATDAQGNTHGADTVESFISGSEAEAAAHPPLPDVEEELGPVAELVKAAAIEVAADVTDAEAFYEAEAEMGVEHEGIEAKQIMGVALATIAVLIVIIITLFQVTDRAARAAYVEAVNRAQYPELREVEAEAARLLGQYEVVRDEQTTYRIPIDRAIDVVVNEARQETGRTYSSELQLRAGN
ncbi:MAG: hypothetical protein D6685_14395 [Bacteroidetes bacterium]|nr:MAG: hypothetical protein D6685_14395 [Bacteroidota bacterium]